MITCFYLPTGKGKIYILFIVISFLLLPANSFAQKLIIKDEITHELVVNANIFSNDHKISTVSDLNGEADISAFSGCDSINITYIGYTPVVFSYNDLQKEDFIVFMNQVSISLDEMIVSATRWEQNKKDIPTRITTINENDVLIQNPQTAADLLGQSGYVYIQKSQLGGGSPMIRGFATNRVLISVDGIRMNNAIFRSGNLQNVISLDPLYISNTEVIFGPGSIMYGSDAIGGVMSFFTIEPEIPTSGTFELQSNTLIRSSTADKEKTGHVDLEYRMKRWAFATSITYTGYGDMKMGKYGPDEYLRKEYAIRQNHRDTSVINTNAKIQIPSGYQQINAMQKVRFMANEFWIFNYGFHYSATGDYPRYDRLIRYKNGYLKSAEWYYGPQKWMMNHLSAMNEKKTLFYDRMAIHIAEQFFRESRHDRNFNNINKHNRTETVNTLNLNLDLEKQFSNTNYLSYGVEYIFNKVGSKAHDMDISTGKTSPAATRYPDGSTWLSMAVFSNYKHKISTKTIMNIGVRYNYVILNSDFDTTFYHFPFTNAHINTGALTGSLGLVYNPNEKTQFMANFSTGFRAPNIDDAGKVFDSEPGAVIVPNPDLRSEYSLNTELGLVKIFAKKIKFDLSAYYTNLINAMVRRDYTLDGRDIIMYDGEMSRVTAIQNASKAYVYGLQSGIEWKLSKNFTFISRINVMKGEEELKNGDRAPLRHATPVFGITHLTYLYDRIEIDLYSAFSGKVPFDRMPPSEISKVYMYATDENGNPYSPAWYTLNIKALYRVNNNFTLTAGVENMTNQRYRPFESGIAAAGINFIFALKASF